MRLSAVVATSMLMVAPTMAENLPVGVVACLSEKYAHQYASYTAKAPDFASDLIDRAACYQNKAEVEAVKLTESKGFTQYQLLSGHKVWVAQAQRPVK